ncbi:hypothetical protein C9J12_22700 [Photobacterium frigidiphilum]|uniref:RstB2 protein n=1 Tax=Photobacterium frigidiphilum TaxID=264736 RepID=A0A2T3J9A2_9GAMM|nr:hypothetical protein [Photobacterium frigidiphilum]PSU45379.1 hypothetical protein C9J12_22700 [Photobacterium frigidiphilum]
MGKKILILGCQHSAGIGKESGKAYSMGSFLVAMPVRSWKNDKGEGFGYGFQCNPKTDKFDFIKSDALLEKITKVHFPARLDLEMEPDPENPLVDVVVDFTVIGSMSFLDDNLVNKK